MPGPGPGQVQESDGLHVVAVRRRVLAVTAVIEARLSKRSRALGRTGNAPSLGRVPGRDSVVGREPRQQPLLHHPPPSFGRQAGRVIFSTRVTQESLS